MRRSRASIAIATAMVLIGAAAVADTATAAAATVQVRDNAFTPTALRLRSGDAVTWSVLDGGHTVRADEERDGVPHFEFPRGVGTLAAGDRPSFLFAERGVYRYHCEVHPGSMFGAIYVDVDPPPPLVRTVPSRQYRTIGAAIAGAPAGTRVDVRPGVYRESVTVDRGLRDLTVRGVGDRPSDVVLDGGARRSVGVVVSAPGVRVENLTVRGFRSRGVVVLGSDRFRIHRVRVIGGEYGIRTIDSRGGGITATVVRDAMKAAVAVVGCDPCGVLIEAVTTARSGTGISVEDAGGVLVLDSVTERNGVGIAVAGRGSASTLSDASVSAPAGGVTVRDNVARANGVAVAVEGGRDVSVVANTVTAYSRAALVWSPPGVGVCFSDNRDPARAGDPVTEPPGLQLLFPCQSGGS